jgi:hypothetical protein
MIDSLSFPRSRRNFLSAALLCGLSNSVLSQAAASDAVLTVSGKGVKRVSQATGATSAGADTASFSLADLAAMQQHSVTSKTPWHDSQRTYSGPLLSDVLAAAGTQSRSASYVALNDYRIEIPADDLKDYPVILAIRLDGKPMTSTQSFAKPPTTPGASGSCTALS